MRNWIKCNAFSLTLSFAIVLLQIIVSVSLATGARPGHVWTGMGWQFADDQAIYLGYVEQIRSGALGLVSLSLPQPQNSFWHPTYVAVGLFARASGLPSAFAYRLSLWFSSVFSVLILHSVSRAVSKNERDASVATLLIIISGGLGWLGVLVLLGAPPSGNGWGLADIGTEAFFFESIFAAPHLPLSIALLPFVLLRIWKSAISAPSIASRRMGWLATLILVLIHPYVVPILCLFVLFAWAYNKQGVTRASVRRYLPYAAAIFIGALPHAWGQIANDASRGLLMRNSLPIKPVWLWALVFAPWIAIVGVRMRQRIWIKKEDVWIVLWVAASICAIALPFKWDNKLAISWHAALVWLGLPVLVLLRDKFLRVRIMEIACVFILSMSSLYIFMQQLPYFRGNISDRLPMYVNASDMAAWQWTRENTAPTSFVLPPDIFAGIWAPPFMQRSVWIGHPMDTPDYDAKKDALPSIRTLTPEEMTAFLDQEKISVILTSDEIQTAQFLSHLGEMWRLGANFNGHGVIVRN